MRDSMPKKSKEILIGKIVTSNSAVTSIVKVFFTEMMVTVGGFYKGVLRIHDPNYTLHYRRINVSPYRNDPDKIERASNLECLVSVKAESLNSPEGLVFNFLEKLKPAS